MRDRDFEEFNEFLEEANKLLFIIKERHKDESVIAANEHLRYSCCHLSRAARLSQNIIKSSSFEYQLQEAKTHCEKALNYALEYAINDCIASIGQYSNDYPETILSEIVPDYFDIKTKCVLAKEFINTKSIDRPYSEYKSHYDAIYEGKLTLSSSDEDIKKKQVNTSAKGYGEKSQFLWLF